MDCSMSLILSLGANALLGILIFILWVRQRDDERRD
jgi:hypothetical protein